MSFIPEKKLHIQKYDGSEKCRDPKTRIGENPGFKYKHEFYHMIPHKYKNTP